MKLRAVKIRLYPNEEQCVFIAKTFGCVRKLYNEMIYDVWNYFVCNNSLMFITPAKYKRDFTYMKEVDSLALANVYLNVKEAYNSYFKKRTRFPKFKKKHNHLESYTTNYVNNNIIVTNNTIKLPKLGIVKCKNHRVLEDSKLKSVTISRTSTNKYYASILYEIDTDNQSIFKYNESMNVLGIDYKMDGLGVYSNGELCSYPKYYRISLDKLKREERKLSKKVYGSKNYYKQKLKVSKIHEVITNQRRDFIHKETKRLSDTYDVIVVEDLNLQGLSKTLHFGKSIYDNAYGMFLSILDYKQKDRGHTLIKVNKFFPSSKRCSVCGNIKDNLELSDRTYTCDCGNTMNRDINAAINIKNEGIRILKEQLV